MSFFPNECFICNTTTSLKRCSRCNLVSFCGEKHQIQNWKSHKTFCNSVSTILKRKGLSHIFEKLKGVSRQTFITESKKLLAEVELVIDEVLPREGIELFKFPRVCFVCFEAKQDLLKNCPNCPFASFCKDHPKSSIHDKDCLEIKNNRDNYGNLVLPLTTVMLKFFQILHNYEAEKIVQTPTSMKDFFEQEYVNVRLEKEFTSIVSEVISVPLTILNVLRKLNISKSEIDIHVLGINETMSFVKSWESILHFLPHIKSLTIYIITNKANSRVKFNLCNSCVSKGKKLLVEVRTLPYSLYICSRFYKKPDLFVRFIPDLYDFNKDQFIMLHEELHIWRTILSCPLVIVYKENVAKFVTENVQPYISGCSLYQKGANDFAPLYSTLSEDDWTVSKKFSQILIVERAGKSEKSVMKAVISGEESVEKKIEEEVEEDSSDALERNSIYWKRHFNHGVCYVCRTLNPSTACKKCKMIFYCSEYHQKVHWPQHKNICKVILGILNETQATSVFDKSRSDKEKSWFKVKLDLLTKVERKIGKQLVDGEREMFMLPKTCLICHASDLSILKTCYCGESFCNIHLRDVTHKKFCDSFALFRNLRMFAELPYKPFKVTVATKDCNEFPSSMDKFIQRFLAFHNFEVYNIPNIQDVLLSQHLTNPLTMVYCAECLYDPCLLDEESMVIHVILPAMIDESEIQYWKILSFWFHYIKHVTVIFIAPKKESVTTPSYYNALTFQLDFSLIFYMSFHKFESKSYLMQYEDYYQSDDFMYPDFVIGFNSNMYKTETESWKKVLHVMTEIQVPFIMTSTNKADRLKEEDFADDCFRIPEIRDKDNPYASLIPEKNVETEELCYSNLFIPIFSFVESRARNKSHKGKTLDDLKKELLAAQAKVEKMIDDPGSGKSDRKIKKAKRRNGKVEPEIKIEKTETKEEKLVANNSLVKNENSEQEKKLKTETEEKEKKEIKTKALETESSECKETSKKETLPEVKNDKLLEGNLEFDKKNKLLNENVLLRNENKELKDTYRILSLHNLTLNTENSTIKSIRRQLPEKICEEIKTYYDHQ